MVLLSLLRVVSMGIFSRMSCCTSTQYKFEYVDQCQYLLVAAVVDDGVAVVVAIDGVAVGAVRGAFGH